MLHHAIFIYTVDLQYEFNPQNITVFSFNLLVNLSHHQYQDKSYVFLVGTLLPISRRQLRYLTKTPVRASRKKNITIVIILKKNLL